MMTLFQDKTDESFGRETFTSTLAKFREQGTPMLDSAQRFSEILFQLLDQEESEQRVRLAAGLCHQADLVANHLMACIDMDFGRKARMSDREWQACQKSYEKHLRAYAGLFEQAASIIEQSLLPSDNLNHVSEHIRDKAKSLLNEID